VANEPRGLLDHQLPLLLFRPLPVRDVSKRDETTLFSFPDGIDGPELGPDELSAGADDVDLGCLLRHDRKAEQFTYQLVCGPAEKRLRGRVYETDHPTLVDDHDPVRVAFDQSAEARFARLELLDAALQLGDQQLALGPGIATGYVHSHASGSAPCGVRSPPGVHGPLGTACRSATRVLQA
jgi:hypothetical protein